MKKVTVFLIYMITTVLLLFIIYLVDSDSEIKEKDTLKDTAVEKEISTSRYYGGIENQSRRLNNNIWGLTNKEREEKNIKQFIYYRYDGSFGWEWDRPDPRPDPDTYIPPTFPEVIVGGDPGEKNPNSPYFPIKVKNITSLISEIEYEWTKYPTGAYDLIYDMFFVDSAIKKQVEISIFIVNHASGTFLGVISDGNNRYDVYYKTDTRGVLIVGFDLQDQDSIAPSIPRYHKINMKILFDYLIKKGRLDPDLDLYGIQLGNEVYRGSGRIQINKFNINLNGNDV